MQKLKVTFCMNKHHSHLIKKMYKSSYGCFSSYRTVPKNTFEHVLVKDSDFMSSTTKYCVIICHCTLASVCVWHCWKHRQSTSAWSADSSPSPERNTKLGGVMAGGGKGESDTSVACHFLSDEILLFCFTWCRKNIKVTVPGTGRKGLV